MRTEKNILLHELIGLECEVIEAKNKSQIGLHGRIIDETMKTIMVSGPQSNKIIPKKGSKFRLKLNNKKIDIVGDFIIARPEDRIKKKLKKW